MYRYIFGPVPSRRLGKSLGVNNIPYKVCTYSCVYCQLGRTTELTTVRRAFFNPYDIVDDVKRFLSNYPKGVDYVTFVAQGEPLLDINIGLEIELMKNSTEVPIAVLTNASLLYIENIRGDLGLADVVSIKIDAVSENTWRNINRPCPELTISKVLEGVEIFAKEFRGRLLVETMAVGDINTDPEEVRTIANFIKRLNPYKAYLSTPMRPPAEDYALPPPPTVLLKVYKTFIEVLGEDRVLLLDRSEPSSFRAYGDPVRWLLSTVSVHPLRLDYAIEALQDVVLDPLKLIEDLEKRGEIEIVCFSKNRFIVRRGRA